MPSKNRSIDPADLDAFVAGWAAERLYLPTTVQQLVQLCINRKLLAGLVESGDASVRLGLLLARLRGSEISGHEIRLAGIDAHSKQRVYALGVVAAGGRNERVPFNTLSSRGGDFPDW